MKYIFKYKDDRKYNDSISDGFRIEAAKNRKGNILMTLYSSKENKIEMTLNSDEAISIAHGLLLAANSPKKVTIE